MSRTYRKIPASPAGFRHPRGYKRAAILRYRDSDGEHVAPLRAGAVPPHDWNDIPASSFAQTPKMLWSSLKY